MNDYSQDMSGRACCDKPLERHVFQGPGETCSVCGRVRALHLDAGFVPSHMPSRMPTDPGIRFGAHPRFSKPGAFNPEHPAKPTPELVKQVERTRAAERRAIELALRRAAK